MFFGEYYSSLLSTRPGNENKPLFTPLLKGIQDLTLSESSAAEMSEFVEKKQTNFPSGCLNEKKNGMRCEPLTFMPFPSMNFDMEDVPSLDELAEAHKNEVAAKRVASDLFIAQSEKSSAVASAKPLRNQEVTTNEYTVPLKSSDVLRKREVLPSLKQPSSFGQLICQQSAFPKKTLGYSDILSHLECPEIKPFDFSTPSPDDVVKNNQRNTFRK